MNTTCLSIADPANPDHGKSIVALLDLYAGSYEGGDIGLSNFSKENLPAALAAHPTAHVILAFSGGEATGLIVAFLGFSTYRSKPLLNIHDLVVHPSHRGEGIAELLLAKTEELAHELDCCKLTLEVLEENRIARNIYASFGFNSYELDPSLGKAMFWEKGL